MAPYHRLDIGVDWHINRERFKSTISVGAYNAYNRSNPFFLNATTKYVPEPNSDGSFNSITILEQFSLFPIIPSIAYRIEF